MRSRLRCAPAPGRWFPALLLLVFAVGAKSFAGQELAPPPEKRPAPKTNEWAAWSGVTEFRGVHTITRTFNQAKDNGSTQETSRHVMAAELGFRFVVRDKNSPTDRSFEPVAGIISGRNEASTHRKDWSSEFTSSVTGSFSGGVHDLSFAFNLRDGKWTFSTGGNLASPYVLTTVLKSHVLRDGQWRDETQTQTRKTSTYPHAVLRGNLPGGKPTVITARRVIPSENKSSGTTELIEEMVVLVPLVEGLDADAEIARARREASTTSAAANPASTSAGSAVAQPAPVSSAAPKTTPAPPPPSAALSVGPARAVRSAAVTSAPRPTPASAEALAGRLTRRSAGASTRAAGADAAAFYFEASNDSQVVASMAAQLSRSASESLQLEETMRASLASTTKDFASDGAPHDLAKAFTYFVVANYAVLHPEVTVDDPLAERLLAQFRSQLLDAAVARSADNASKQTLFETLVIQAALTVADYQNAVEKNDAARQALLRTKASEALRAFFNTDAAALRLDPTAKLPLVLNAVVAAPAVVAPKAPAPAAKISSGSSAWTATSGIVGVWWGARLMVSATGGLQSSEECLVFFPDGTFGFDLPRRGLESFDAVVARAEQPRIWGRYTFDGNAGLMTGLNQGGEAFHLTPAGALAMFGTEYGRGWCPSGWRIEGRYGVAGLDGPELLLTAAGRFEDRGLLGAGDILGSVAEFRQPGAGAYEIRDFSLLLRYDDGRQAKVSCYVRTPADAAANSPEAIFLNKLRRVRLP